MPPKKSKRSKKTTKKIVDTSGSEEKSNENTAADSDKQIEEQQTENDFRKEIENYKRIIANLEEELEKYKAENYALKNQNKKSQSDDVKVDNSFVRVTRVKSEDSYTPPSLSKNKGCSCKGNCSTKICGCVKKGLSCQEFCKCCMTRCRNQDDKENDKNEQEEMTSDGKQVLEKLGQLSLNQEILHASEKKIKRGLNSPLNESNNTTMGRNNSRLHQSKRKLFSQDSNDLIDIPNNSHIDSTTTSSDCTDKNPNELPKIIITKEIQTDPSLKMKNEERSKLAKISIKDEHKIERQNSVNEIDSGLPPDEACENEYINFRTRYPKVQHSPIKPLSETSSSNVAQDSLLNEKVEGRYVKIQNSPEASKRHFSMDLNKVPQLNRLQTNHMLEPDKSDKNCSNDFLNQSLNPMVPKRQLLRSPIAKGGELSSPASTKKMVPIEKPELAIAEIDWEQHQAELVKCNICKRKFFPHRIEKHKLSCKGI